jgi:hypothetical protein
VKIVRRSLKNVVNIIDRFLKFIIIFLRNETSKSDSKKKSDNIRMIILSINRGDVRGIVLLQFLQIL